MQLIDVDDVVIPEDRQRKTFDETALQELLASILRPHGLLQPIVLRNDEKTLVAGERRLRAIKTQYAEWQKLFDENKGKTLKLSDYTIRHNGEPVPFPMIPYVKLSQLNADELREAELEENVRRVDLTWQELVQAQAAFHQHLSQKNPEQTFTDTAKEVFGDKVNKRKVAEIAEAVRLAEFLDDPLVSAAEDRKQARRAVRDTEKWRERKERLASFEVAASESNLHIFHGDVFERAPEDLKDVKLDVIITDPPYGIDAHKKGKTFDGDQHNYDDSDAYFSSVIIPKLPEVCRSLSAPQAHVYCFCDIRRFFELFAAFELCGFTVWPRPIIWDKGTVGSYGNIQFGPRACYDAILFANKGKKEVTGGYRDVINIAQETHATHPAHKPRGLYSELLKRSALPGDTVADFFAGGGPIFAAAAEHSCIAYGWEINEEYYELSLDTIREVSK